MRILSENVLFSILKNAKNAPRNNILADCPFCLKEKHFFVFKGEKKDRIHPFICHKCKESGDINVLLRKLDKTYLIEGERVTGLKVLNLSVQEDITEHKDASTPTIKYPIGFHRLVYDDGRLETEYLINRGFTEQDFEETTPGYTELKAKLIGYAIFPIIKDFALKAYVSRDIINDKEFDEDRLRYRNSLSEFSKLLYGYDRLTMRTKIIILVEGVFDAIAVNRKLNLYDQDEMVCLATFGNKMSSEQFHLLSKYKTIEQVFLMYDVRDSVEIMKKVGTRLSKYYSFVNVCYLNSGDPDESTAEQIENALINSVDFIEFKYQKVQVKKFT